MNKVVASGWGKLVCKDGKKESKGRVVGGISGCGDDGLMNKRMYNKDSVDN